MLLSICLSCLSVHVGRNCMDISHSRLLFSFFLIFPAIRYIIYQIVRNSSRIVQILFLKFGLLVMRIIKSTWYGFECLKYTLITFWHNQRLYTLNFAILLFYLHFVRSGSFAEEYIEDALVDASFGSGVISARRATPPYLSPHPIITTKSTALGRWWYCRDAELPISTMVWKSSKVRSQSRSRKITTVTPQPQRCEESRSS